MSSALIVDGVPPAFGLGVMTVREMEKTETTTSELRSVRKLTSPSMKMPRCKPRTVSSGTDALSLFMSNCARQVGARHRLGLLWKTSDAELYSARRTRDYVTGPLGRQEDQPARPTNGSKSVVLN